MTPINCWLLQRGRKDDLVFPLDCDVKGVRGSLHTLSLVSHAMNEQSVAVVLTDLVTESFVPKLMSSDPVSGSESHWSERVHCSQWVLQQQKWARSARNNLQIFCSP